MPKNKNLHKQCNIESYCNHLANQRLILVTIFATIISQEIENDDDLGLLAAFLVALGDELALVLETRSVCKAKFEGESSLPEEIENVFVRGCSTLDSKKKVRKVKRKYVKK